MATSSGAMWLTWCKLLMICKVMDIKRRQALLRLLHNINHFIDSDVREESLEALIEIVGVEVVTESQLQRGYWLSESSRKYLLENIGNNESH